MKIVHVIVHVALLIVAQVGSVCSIWARYSSLTHKERDQICQSKDAKCIWLNDHFRPHGLPLHSSLCCQCKPDVICYDGPLTADTLVNLWDKLHITVKATKRAKLVGTFGNSSQEALSNGATSHNLSFPLYFNPFGTHCVALKRQKCNGGSDDVVDYSIDARREMWPLYPVLMAMGLFLLFMAPTLSRNIPLIYGTGITIGIFASLLVLLYVLSRYMPGKNFLGMGFLFGGYTVVGGVMYWFLNNMVDVLYEYWQYVAGYVVIAGLISFAVIYYWGGVTNPRTFDLIQWSLQMFGLIFIFMTTALTETSLAVIVLTLLTYHTPLKYNPLLFPFWVIRRFCSLVCSYVRSLGPPPPIPVRRFLTMEEYDEQGKIETKKAIEELKKYCSIHEDVYDNLHENSRTRFRKFVGGKSGHVTEEEIVNHDWTYMEESSSSESEGSFQNRSASQPSVSPSPPSSRHSSYSRHSYSRSESSLPRSSAHSHPSSSSTSSAHSHPSSSSSSSHRPRPSYPPSHQRRHAMYHTTPAGV